MFPVSKGVLEAIGMDKVHHMKDDSSSFEVNPKKMRMGGHACHSNKSKLAMGGVGKLRLHESKNMKKR